MQWENLFYALTQFVHNFGALAVVGGALGALKTPVTMPDVRRKLAWLVLGGWGVQALSGLIFGAISVYFYGEPPDLHATARAALVTKVVCAASGIVLALLYLTNARHWSEKGHRRAWQGLTVLGATALTAAAFLRWFS